MQKGSLAAISSPSRSMTLPVTCSQAHKMQAPHGAQRGGESWLSAGTQKGENSLAETLWCRSLRHRYPSTTFPTESYPDKES